MAGEFYPEMIPDIDRMDALLRQLRADTTQYARVVGPVGAPTAVLTTHTSGNLWASRKHSTVLLWYADRPGEGFALLKDFRQWVRDQKSITLAGFMDDFGIDARLVAALRRFGFIQRGGCYAYFPRGAKK